ncbi:A/G-specific adenine glycosylase [Blattabacterium cuenoti]|uniref:A/G-specific adenine glycosylase n=1 Tax=Blattabacterium cuenoti TaxID=1653831 RepID=UPI00163C02DE|nr:A/G-specific adenine glycosylase [Blattabacterium cuenoti]
MDFSKKIINWYKINHRKLPWRETKNPYYILVSEFMLQQTRVSKTIEYYLNFIKRFPSLKKLAQAEEKDVLKKWEGLGYYSRAKYLHSFAIKLSNDKKFFPKKYQELIKYKGIGPYTGAAIASICFQEAIPAVDGNTCRVFSRYLGIYKNVALISTKNMLQVIISKIIDTEQPGIFNQAIMDLGSILCTPKNPKCFLCPVKNSCFSIKNKTVHKLPIKKIKKFIKHRFFYYLFICDQNNNICINKRSNKDIWRGLYDFPLIESKVNLSIHEVIDKFCKKIRVFVSISNTFSYNIEHKLTHQILLIRFLNCKILQNKNIFFDNFFFIPHNKISEYPFPSPVILFLKHEKVI